MQDTRAAARQLMELGEAENFLQEWTSLNPSPSSKCLILL